MGTVTTPAIMAAHSQIGRLARLRQIQNARKVFDEMPQKTITSFNSIIHAYFLNKQPKQAQAIFTSMPVRNTATYNTVLSGLIGINQFDDALSVFNVIPEPNVVSWTSMLRGYVREGRIAEAEEFFRRMPEKNMVTWTVMIDGLIKEGRVEDARVLYEEMPVKDVVVRTNMICGFCRAGRVGEARELFDGMPKRNVVSWTAMVSGYASNGQVDLARELFEVMPEKNEISWTAMLTGYAQAGRINNAVEIFHRMPEKPLIACNVIITGLGQNGMVDKAEEIFNQMVEKDNTTWSAMIKIYEQNGLHVDALNSFRSMQINGYGLNYPSLISALTVCASLAVLDHGKQVHGSMIRNHLDSDVFVVSALVTMYVKCGDLPKGRQIFDTFPMKDVAMWNSMITGYSQHGHACSYTGMLKDGKEIFDSMVSKFSVKPKIEHYACMVDLLSRAGLFKEAARLIQNMPIEPDAIIWGALLGGCRIHKNAKIAEVAVTKLLYLEPWNTGPYILLSNIYASHGRWKDAATIRKYMGVKNLNKSPGCSWIDVGKKVHIFTGGDMCEHPENTIISSMLERLDTLLKETGYCPDGSFALHDVDEEEKSHNLRYHSERQAVAYGLLKVREGLPIRVMKNLRVCGDCHSAIKLIAKITRREIILRDANRFHHFKDGSCSCGDYW